MSPLDPGYAERFRNRRSDDGRSRPFGGTGPREILAETLARRDGWAEIRHAIRRKPAG